MPDGDRAFTRSVDPRFLISSEALKVRLPKFIFSSFSVHLLGIGAGQTEGEGKQGVCTCLLTFHKLDKETGSHSQKLDWTLEEQAKGGLVGRLVWGVFQKLFGVIKLGGAVPLHGELADSTSYLALMLINMVHNFNMDTIAAMEVWMATLEQQIEDLAVTKHNTHIDHMRRLCFDSLVYIKPFHELIFDATLPGDKEPAKEKKRKGQSETIINREVVFPFLGRIGSRYIYHLLDGSQQSESKGSAFWLKKLERCTDHIDRLEFRYSEKLDEKRNFWGFLFTLVSLVLWPISSLIGYYGMNYDNMEEEALHSVGYFGGMTFFWLIAGLIYFVMIMWMLEKKVIYMGT